MPVLHMAVGERDAASLGMPVRRQVPPKVLVCWIVIWIVYYHHPIVDALFMVVHEREDLDRICDLRILRFDVGIAFGILFSETLKGGVSIQSVIQGVAASLLDTWMTAHG